jgi:hypothetical protein
MIGSILRTATASTIAAGDTGISCIFYANSSPMFAVADSSCNSVTCTDGTTCAGTGIKDDFKLVIGQVSSAAVESTITFVASKW